MRLDDLSREEQRFWLIAKSLLWASTILLLLALYLVALLAAAAFGSSASDERPVHYLAPWTFPDPPQSPAGPL
jgi:hypothetical protein